MVRPHPAVWRFIHGVLMAYFLLLVFLLFQDVSYARQFLRVRTLSLPDSSSDSSSPSRCVLRGCSCVFRSAAFAHCVSVI